MRRAPSLIAENGGDGTGVSQFRTKLAGRYIAVVMPVFDLEHDTARVFRSPAKEIPGAEEAESPAGRGIIAQAVGCREAEGVIIETKGESRTVRDVGFPILPRFQEVGIEKIGIFFPIVVQLIVDGIGAGDRLGGRSGFGCLCPDQRRRNKKQRHEH
ncbi:MAG: hypothetical protein WBM78_14105 [Desulfobacterales bacterium]